MNIFLKVLRFLNDRPKFNCPQCTHSIKNHKTDDFYDDICDFIVGTKYIVYRSSVMNSKIYCDCHFKRELIKEHYNLQKKQKT